MAIFDRSWLGPSIQTFPVGSGVSTSSFNVSTVGNGISHRFVATDSRNVSYVWINFSAVTTPNLLEVRIETDNGSGKPSGTLYDANATVTITPSTTGTAGWQQCTFATTPTTGLVKDDIYHVVIIASTSGSGVTSRAYWTIVNGINPNNTLTATDATTRTNFTENASSAPVCALGLTDGTTTTLVAYGMPFATSSNFVVYGNRAYSVKYVIPTNTSLTVYGVATNGALRTGTPDDLRVSIYNESNTLVPGSQALLRKEGLANASTRRLIFNFSTGVVLTSGTYRVVIEQRNGASASATNSSNTWTFYNAVYISALKPSGFTVSTTTDISSGVGSATWTDSSTDVGIVDLLVDTFGSTGGGGGSYTAASNVRSGVDRGDGTIGTLVVPTSGNVLLGVAVDSVSGTLVLPANTNVRNGTIYGVNGTSLTGNVTVPAVGSVLYNTQFGANGTEYTGTLVVPSNTQVVAGIQFGSGGNQYTGNVILPASGSVVLGVTYGANGNQYTGSYSVSGGGTYTSASNVRSGTDRGDGVIGTLVVPSPSNVLTGVSTDNTTGTLTIPLAATVLTGAIFGVGGSSVTGTVVLPGANDVRFGIPYGAGGNGLTGKIVVPAVTNVRSGIAFDRDSISTGTVVLPAVSDVAGGIQYGAGGTQYTGTYSGSGGLTYSQLTSALDARGLTTLPSGSLYPKVNIGQVNGVSASTYDGTAQAGTSTTITLQTGSATGNIYLHRTITLVSGTGAGQSRAIVAASGLVMQVDSSWVVTPDSTTKYIIGDTVHSWIIGAAAGISLGGSYGTPWGVIYTDGSSPMFGSGQKWTPGPNDPF